MGKKGKTVETIAENNKGRNQLFRDKSTGIKMTRAEFVKKIDKGNYDDYHTREINGVKTPVSNPDKKNSNNLG